MWNTDNAADGSERIHSTRFSQPVVYVYECAMFTTLLELRLLPPRLTVLGHSLGEFAAAFAAGQLSFADGLRLVAARARVMADTPAQGGVMLACRLTKTEAVSGIEELKSSVMPHAKIAVAAVNGPRSIVLSGEKPAIQALLAHLKKPSDFGKYLNVSHAFHSPLMNSTLGAMAPIFAAVKWQSHTPSKTSTATASGSVSGYKSQMSSNEIETTTTTGTKKVTFVSTVLGRAVSSAELREGNYWESHIVRPVLFHDAIVEAAKKSTVFLEIGPKPVLAQMSKACLPSDLSPADALILSVASGKESSALDDLAVVAQHSKAAPGKVEHIWNYAQRFEWMRSAHPLTGTPPTSIPGTSLSTKGTTPTSVAPTTTSYVMDPIALSFFNDHQVMNSGILPGAGIAEAFLAGVSRCLFPESLACPVRCEGRWLRFRAMKFLVPLVLVEDAEEQLKVIVSRKTSEDVFQLANEVAGQGWTVNAEAEGFEMSDTPPVLDPIPASASASGPSGQSGDMGGSDNEVNVSASDVNFVSQKDFYAAARARLERLEARFSVVNGGEDVDVKEHYKLLARVGLKYGTHFQTVQKMTLNAEKTEVWSELASRTQSVVSSLGQMESCFIAHPAVLDGAFQTIAVVLASCGRRDAMIPSEIQNLTVSKISVACKYYAHVRLLSNRARTAAVSLEIYNQWGAVVCAIDRVKLTALETTVDFPRNLFWTSTYINPQDSNTDSETEAVKADGTASVQADGTTAEETSVLSRREYLLSGEWLVFGEVKLPQLLNFGKDSRGKDLTVKLVPRAVPKNDTEADISVRERPWRALLYTGGLLQSLEEAEVLGDALVITKSYARVYQGLNSSQPLPQLILLGRSSLPTQLADGASSATARLHSGLVGFMRSARLEMDNMLSREPPMTFVDIDQKLLPGLEAPALEDLTSVFERLATELADNPLEAELLLRESTPSESSSSSLVCRMASVCANKDGSDGTTTKMDMAEGYMTVHVQSGSNVEVTEDFKHLGLKITPRPDKLPTPSGFVVVRLQCFALTKELCEALLAIDENTEEWSGMPIKFSGVVAGAESADFPLGALVCGEAAMAWGSYALVSSDCLQLMKPTDSFSSAVSYPTSTPMTCFLKTSEDIASAARSLHKMKVGEGACCVCVYPSPVSATMHNCTGEELAKSTWLITGGFGALGLATAEWLATEGVQSLVLTSRSGAIPSSAQQQPQSVTAADTATTSFATSSSGAAASTGSSEVEGDGSHRRLARLRNEKLSAVKVIAHKGDMSVKTDVKAALETCVKDGRILKGVIHAAGRLNDFPMSNQTKLHIDTVFVAKATSARHLDETLDELNLNANLEHFICYSSISSLLGNFSQVNYSAANAVLDFLCEERVAQNKAGLSLQWGPWIELGMASSLVGLLDKVGMKGLSNDTAFRAMYAAMVNSLTKPTSSSIGSGCDSAMDRSRFCVAVQQFNFRRMLKRYSTVPLFYSALPKSIVQSGADAGAGAIDLSRTTHAELCEVLADIAQQVSGTSLRPTAETSLIDVGFDSLGAVEFRNNILDTTGVRLTQTLAFENPTLGAVADFVLATGQGKGHTSIAASGSGDGSGDGLKAAAAASSAQPVEGFVLKALSSERYTLYIEAFELHFPTTRELRACEDIEGALVDKLKVPADSDDYHRLALAWNELLDSAGAAQGTAGASTGVVGVKRTGADVPHPLEDLEMLKNELKFDVTKILPPVPERDAKRVLLTGVTGFVGRNQILSLLKAERHRDLVVYALVRARDPSHAMARIEEACDEACVWSEIVENGWKERIVAVPGDFTQPMLGLSAKDFQWMTENIDIVFHTGGDVNLLCNYSKVRDTNTLSIRGVVQLCTTHRLKPLNFTSTLGQYPEFFAFFTNEFLTRELHEDTGPRMEEMERFFPPKRQGYPWSKWAAEQVIRKAREMGLPAMIYRLPNTYCAHKTGYTNRTDYATALTISTVQEGMFPISAAFSALTPVDVIADMVVEAGLLDSDVRKFWCYNLIDTRLIYQPDMELWAREAGIQYNGVPVDDFLNAVKKRGPESPVYRFVPLMQYWRRFWFDPEVRESDWPIRTQNIFDELPHMSWPPLREVFRNSFLYCARRNFFAANTNAIQIDADTIMDSAAEACHLDDLGPDAEFYLEPITKPLQDAIGDGSQVPFSFIGKLSLYRTSKQYLVNLLAMTEMEKRYPEILEEKIEAPLIIIGLNRSGTTFLQNLLDKDRGNRSILYMEQICPYGANAECVHTRDADGNPDAHKIFNQPIDVDLSSDFRAAQAQEVLDTQNGLTEEWMLIHAQDALKPEEEFLIMEHSGRSYSISVAFGSGDYTEFLFKDDFKEMARAYTFHKRFLQHLQHQRKSERVLLKMPFHLFTLAAMLETYPDAKVVMMHRDPVQVMGSWCSLVTHARARTLFRVDSAEIGRSELQTMSLMMNRAIEYRQSIRGSATEKQFLDVQFEDLVQNPMAQVETIYKHFNLPLTSQSRTAMEAYVAEYDASKRKSNRRHQYSLQDAGLTDADVMKAFANYYTTFAAYLSKK